MVFISRESVVSETELHKFFVSLFSHKSPMLVLYCSSSNAICNSIMVQKHITADVVVTEESAETEKAWTNAGTRVGLQIWRIVVSFKLVVPTNNLRCC